MIGKIEKERDRRAEKLPDPIETIKLEMRRRGLTNKDLVPCMGGSGNVTAVLKRRRPLSLRMIRCLHAFLHIPAEILIQSYECRK